MKLDMIVLAVTRDLGIEMKEILFGVGQSKLKQISQVVINPFSASHVFLASELMIEVSFCINI
jgi:hypothetical protein